MTPSLRARTRDLLQRSRSTNSARDHAAVILERKEALRLLEENAEALEAATKEFIALESRLFELVGLATRGRNGHSWLTDLPLRENGSEFYQALHALARYCRNRAMAKNPE